MKKRTLLPAMVIATLLTASMALASPGFGGQFGPGCDGGCNGRGQGPMSYEQHEERSAHRLEMMAAVLDLTADQQAQIKNLLDQQWQNRQADRDEMQAAREAMQAARLATPFDEADFRAKAAKQAELRTERMVERAKLQQQINAILTPEQQAKAETLGGMMGGFGKGRGMGMGGGGCRS